MRTKRTRRIGIWAVLAGALATGCAGDKKDAPAEPKPAQDRAVDQTRVRETSGGSYHVSYAPFPYPIPLNKVFALEVRVYTDAAMTTRAKDVTIGVDAAMPSHHHGMNLVPRAERIGDGIFRVTGMLFHMPGYWEIYVDVREGGREGGREERARFEVQL
jgi:hypothetical protein